VVDRALIVAGRGAGAPNPNQVRTFGREGTPTGVEFSAYAAGSWGVHVAAGDLGEGGQQSEIVTGPGPGGALGPHTRGFHRGGAPIAAIGFFAYGTLRYGVNVSVADLDGGVQEMMTGAGAGAVFGPHVRGWRYSGTAVGPVSGCSFFAYGTLKYGVDLSGGALDPDAFEELATGAGPGPNFGAHVRGWNHDGQGVSAIPGVTFMAFSYPGHGVHVALGDLGRSWDIAAAPGPGPLHPARVRAFHYDLSSVTPLMEVDVLAFGTHHGARVGVAVDRFASESRALAIGGGPDPSAPATLKLYETWGGLSLVGYPFTTFPGAFGVNVSGGALTP
jgi:hypothetical protein